MGKFSPECAVSDSKLDFTSFFQCSRSAPCDESCGCYYGNVDLLLRPFVKQTPIRSAPETEYCAWSPSLEISVVKEACGSSCDFLFFSSKARKWVLYSERQRTNPRTKQSNHRGQIRAEPTLSPGCHRACLYESSETQSIIYVLTTCIITYSFDLEHIPT